jgi:hypothetical protein
MWSRPGISIEARLIGLECRPIDEAGVVFGDEDRPLLDRQMT